MDAIKNIVLLQLSNARLKITPQRMAVLEVLIKSIDHPTAESIHKQVQETIPGISATTIYNTLDTFTEKGLIGRVKTDSDIMRYEPLTGHHHHLYSYNSERMEDYFDDELDELLKQYFEQREIKDFVIKEIRLQLMGDFKK